MIPIIKQHELREKFNPEGSPLRDYQNYLFKILCDFDSVCKKLGVKYWLSQGTVLGAVRHGGFIPWDDDIDVEMLYEDYVKFLSFFKENNDYVVQTIHTDPFYPLPFAKFRDKNSLLHDRESAVSRRYKYKGAFIDIFYTEYRVESISHILNYFYIAAAKTAICVKNKYVAKAMIYTLTRTGYYGTKLVRSIMKKTKLGKMGLGYGSHFFDIKSEECDLFPLKKIEFEGREFPAPKNCDNYLKKIYGDYMKLPDIDQIRTHISEWEKLNI